MSYRTIAVVVSCIATITSYTFAQDWPQWRGANRDGKAAGFEAPASWPKELTQKWKVPVGDGVSTPALVGDKVYVYARQDGNEILRCLDAGTGEELWQDQHPAEAVTGGASNYAGPRSSPTVADGKVVTLGVQGVLSCLDAATGEVIWRNDEYEGSVPRFAAASSPIVVNGLCIAQLGGDEEGGTVALDLSTGDEKWKWTGDGPSYGSPVLMSVGGTQAIITPTSENMVALRVEDGKLLQQTSFKQGRYNASTPIVDGQIVVNAAPTRGTMAEKVIQDGEEFTSEKLWENTDNSLAFNTPVFRDGRIFGLSKVNNLFCVNVETGKTAWNEPIGAATAQPPAAGGRQGGRGQDGAAQRGGGQRGEGRRARGEGRQARQGRGGRRRGRGPRPGYGSIVDAGTVLLALSPASELIVFEPNGEAYTELAKYKVADLPTHAHPVVSGNRIFIKDKESLILWTVE